MKKEKLLQAITNCKKGSSDMGLYDCGALAVKAGTLSLGPMVKPAAIEKMRWAINNAKGENRVKYQKENAKRQSQSMRGFLAKTRIQRLSQKKKSSKES